VEYIRLEDELAEGVAKKEARGGPIGLGFRVPLLIASPWSRGGRVCSQVFDHTSILQFLEGFLEKKFRKKITETQISGWRRTVTGDLTAVFRPYHGEKHDPLPFLQKDPFIEKIYNAKFRKLPSDFKPLSEEEKAAIRRDPSASPLMPRQERGVRPSCGVPCQLYVDGALTDDRGAFRLTFTASRDVFADKALGSAFNAYPIGIAEGGAAQVACRSYGVRSGDTLEDNWELSTFQKGLYHLRAYGPNGFFREFRGTASDPGLSVVCDYERRQGVTRKLTGNVTLNLFNGEAARSLQVEITDHTYGNPKIIKTLQPGISQLTVLRLDKSHGWYDFSVRAAGSDAFERRYAGHVETGTDSFTDPAMGRQEG
jgi:phospholipase C